MDYYFKKEVCFDLLIILMRNCMKMCDFMDIYSLLEYMCFLNFIALNSRLLR